ncbi:ABC transporter substrate-binding protein [Streptomyces huasconensis]|uniref:ABC transporter substrate-binding protein n=1 Tax=Streptomyces huasconensis TaxID=1854574 RepID=A0ABV3M4V4_9ACTN
MRVTDVLVRPARGLGRLVFVRPFTRLRGRPPGPAEKGVAGVVALALLIAAVVVAVPWVTRSDCSQGLQEQRGECVGLLDATASSPSFKPGQDGPHQRFARLIADVAQENGRVRDAWEKPKEDADREPYVKVALLLPFNPSESGAMTAGLIEHALAGAYAAQLKANEKQTGVNIQMLLGNIGTDLSLWRPAVDEATDLAKAKKVKEDDAPLIGVLGLPNSEKDSQDAASALSEAGVPAVSGVLSSPDIEADTFFKVAPNNRNAVKALARYLREESGRKQGYLVWDSRAHDNYVSNTKTEFEATFGKTYSLGIRQHSYVGTMGPYQGAPHAVAAAAAGICRTGSNTVFVAGRDWDLPYLVDAIAKQPECGNREAKDRIRILRVSTGLTPRLTTDAFREKMERAGVVTLNAAATDVPSWRADQDAPGQFRTFTEAMAEHTGLEGAALDDGYAVMHYDAFQVLSLAVEQAKKDMGKRELPSRDDVKNKIANMRILPDKKCHDCVTGATGDFGYIDGKGNWPVCKRVPIVLFPRPKDHRPAEAYRTFQGEDGSCPVE